MVSGHGLAGLRGWVELHSQVLAEAQPAGSDGAACAMKAKRLNDDPFHHDSRRFEVATSCVPLMAGLRCSLDLLEQVGPAEQRWRRIRELSSRLWEQLTTTPGLEPLLESAPQSGLVSFQFSEGQSTAEVVKQLGKSGVWIRDLADPVCLRACTHVMSNDTDLAQLMDALNKQSGRTTA